MKAPSPAVAAAALALVAAACLVLAPPAQAHPPRSPAAVAEFLRQHPCPSTGKPSPRCPGHVLADAVPACAQDEQPAGELRWLSWGQARDRRAWEREYCRFHHARRRNA